eukprot:RCo051801
MAEITEQSAGTLQGTLERSAGAVMDAFAVSQEQVLAMSAELLSRSLAQFVGSLEDFLGSKQSAMQTTYTLIRSLGVDLNNVDEVLALAPYVFSALSMEKTYSMSFMGALSELVVVYTDLTPLGFPRQAVISAGPSDLLSTYAVNASTLRVVYPTSRCFAGLLMYCNLSITLRSSPDFVFGATLGSGELRYASLRTAFAGRPYKYVLLATAFRAPDNTLQGILGRNVNIHVLVDLLQALVAGQPSQRMYLLDMHGILLASSNIDPSQVAPITKPRPFENVLAYPEAIVNQSAKFLLQKYGSWANLSSGGLDTANLTNLTTGQAEEYFVQAARVQVLNLDWVAVCMLPVRLYEGSVLDSFAALRQSIVEQSVSLLTEMNALGVIANAKIGTLMTDMRQRVQDTTTESERVFRTGVIASLSISAGILCVAVLAAVGFSLAITRPLRVLAAYQERVARMDVGLDMGLERTQLSWLWEIRQMQESFST